MKFATAFLAFLLLPAVGLALVNVGSEEDSKSPVARVVELLTDIKAQLEKEAASDSETYDEQACWCKTTEEEKTTAIAAADSKISDLEAAMGSHSAQDATLDVQIADMKAQIAADEEALKQATSIREAEAAAFTAEEKQMVTDISNLKNAIAVLSKHHEQSAFVQDASPIDASLRTVLRDISARYDIMVARKSQNSRPVLLDVKAHNASAVASASPAAALLSILGDSSPGSVLPVDIAARELEASAKARPAAFMQVKAAQLPAATHLGKYSSQSSEVWGILNTMLEEFEADLSQEQKDELKAREAFEALKASKTEQIKLGKDHLDQMQEAAAVNGKALSDSKEDLALTREQRSTDVEFLSNLRLTCQNLDSDWAERSKTRSEEIQAVTEALAILREDDNREQLAKSISFLQQGSDHRVITVNGGLRLRSVVASVRNERSQSELAERAMRSKAAATLRHAARDPGMDLSDLLQAWQGRGANVTNAGSHSDRLAVLAVSAELDSFTEVKKAIDQMISDLKAEQQEEVETKDYCQTEFRGNDKATYEKTEEEKDLAAEIESLEGKMAKLQEEIDAANTEIAATQKAVKEAGENREKENQEFQVTVTDQRAAQDILTKTLKRLEAFYKTQEEATELVQKTSGKQTPPVQFNDYKKNAGAPSVMSFIQQIINDSKKLEGEATTAENEAQVSYEDYVKSSSATILQLQQTVVSTTKSLAQASQEKEQAEAEHRAATSELEDLSLYKADLHGQCDFLLKNFDLRQKARLEEVEALQSAKSILSGAQ